MPQRGRVRDVHRPRVPSSLAQSLSVSRACCPRSLAASRSFPISPHIPLTSRHRPTSTLGPGARRMASELAEPYMKLTELTGQGGSLDSRLGLGVHDGVDVAPHPARGLSDERT
jgi:hypothetical protein